MARHEVLEPDTGDQIFPENVFHDGVPGKEIFSLFMARSCMIWRHAALSQRCTTVTVRANFVGRSLLPPRCRRRRPRPNPGREKISVAGGAGRDTIPGQTVFVRQAESNGEAPVAKMRALAPIVCSPSMVRRNGLVDRSTAETSPVRELCPESFWPDHAFPSSTPAP